MKHCLLFIVFTVSVITCVNCAYLENNAYKGISVSFSKRVQPLRLDFEKLKNTLKNASQLLYRATRRRSYFGEFVFSVPSSWSSDAACESFTQRSPQGIDIYVTDIPTIPELKAQHSKPCGKSGDVIYMPKFWYKGDIGDLARQFLQQWSIFRYGVFEEHSESSGACFASSEGTWSPVGCYNTNFNTEVQYDDGGIPQCYFSDDFLQHENFNSSVMTFYNLSKVIHFCDGTKKYPHNPIMPTLHNNLCQGRNTWTIVQNSEDFANGRNSSKSDEVLKEKTTFRCFREPALQVTFAIQNSTYKTVKDNEYKAFLETVVELRYALLHFLSNMAPKESSVDLLTFSDAPTTEAGSSVQLDLSKKDELEAILDSRIGVEEITKICALCGLRKALNVSQTKDHPFPIVVLIAWESALVGEKISDLTEELQKYPNVVFHLILMEDTDSDVLPSTFVDAVKRTRGHIFNLAKEMVVMSAELNQALASVFKTPLHIEDNIIVIHQKTYFNVSSNIVDVFKTQSGAMGELLYMMHCNDNDMISSRNDSCEAWDPKSSTFKCGEITSLTDNKSPEKVWAYSFKYSTRPIRLICSSIAMLKVTSTSDNSFTLRGWLNDDKITPGYNALIIYAEVIKFTDQDLRVQARISGPKLDSTTIELRDNGNGDPDTKKGDNIYSRYFTSYSEKGTYTVTVYAETLHGKQYSWMSEGNTDKFSQTKVIGSFTVMESAPSMDIYPPNRIGDLKLLSVNHSNKTVTLQWTAPGNNYDSGRAAEYKVYFSQDWKNLQDTMLDKVVPDVMEATEGVIPNSSGEQECLEFYFPNISFPAINYITVVSKDENGNKGQASNVVQAFVGFDENDVNSNKTEANITDPTPGEMLQPDDGLNWHVVTAGSAGLILLIIIIINVLIWAVCFRRYKQRLMNTNSSFGIENKAVTKDEARNSQETIFRTEMQARQENRVDDSQFENDEELEKFAQSHTSIHYAKVYKKLQRERETAPKSIQQNANRKNNENDLGFV